MRKFLLWELSRKVPQEVFRSTTHRTAISFLVETTLISLFWGEGGVTALLFHFPFLYILKWNANRFAIAYKCFPMIVAKTHKCWQICVWFWSKILKEDLIVYSSKSWHLQLVVYKENGLSLTDLWPGYVYNHNSIVCVNKILINY